MVVQFEDLGTALGDLGMALIRLAKYEDEDGAKTGSYTDSSAAAKDISANSKRIGNVRCAFFSAWHNVLQGFAGCEAVQVIR